MISGHGTEKLLSMGFEILGLANDAERHSLHKSDAEISELESEILALKVKGKKLLNNKWNVSSLFKKNIEDSTTLILPNPNDPEKRAPFLAQAYH